MSPDTRPARKSNIIIRSGSMLDRDAIRSMLDSVFGGTAEGLLVERLREDGLAIVELVAIVDDQIVGQVMFSTLQVSSTETTIRAAALAPLAVLPLQQRRGIGSQLVWQGIEQCREAGVEAVIVVGDPGYYRRFGFASELAARLTAPYSGEAFMAFELQNGALEIDEAIVRYPDAFSHVS